MKRCLKCDAKYLSSISQCPACHVIPIHVDNFPAFAPDMAIEGNGFKSTYFSQLAHLEDNNFWFRSRNQLIIWALKKYRPDFHSLLEIGCGTGFVLSGISHAFPNVALYGSELFTAGLDFAAARLPSVNFMQMDAQNIPFVNEFDVIGAFDVLEHIENDEGVLKQIYAALNPKGFLFVTVPQHHWLWSSTDEQACHVRRYNATDLHKKIQAARFHIVKSTSFVSILLPAMMASRLLKKKGSNKIDDELSELKIAPWLNEVLYKCLLAEFMCIKKGISFPLGGSRLVIARKT